jgi:hypothetical protein
LCTSRKISQSITHLKIAPDQAHLTPKFFIVSLLKKKVYLDDINILLILLNLELECHKAVSIGTYFLFAFEYRNVALIRGMKV